MRVLPVNRETILVELPGLEAVLALHASLLARPVEGIEEMLPAAQTIMVQFDPARISAAALLEQLSTRELDPPRGPAGPSLEIPIRYDGEDLADVAALAGLTVDDVIRRHQHSEFTVGFCGFSPGFAYLVGGDPALHVPRRPTPRARVPAGAVAIGGVYCGVYPQPTPGGWHLIGTTTLAIWDLGRDPPALLTPGTRVRFREETSSVSVAVIAPLSDIARGLHADHSPEPSIDILAASLPAFVQDRGRRGHAHIGVSASGALDRIALQTANRAVGNPPDLPCLEIAFGNFAFRCSGDLQIAFAGAPAAITGQRAAGDIFGVMLGQPIDLGYGDSVTLGYPARGVRTYLAVRGGFAVPHALGSASRDILSGIGPPPVVKGSRLAVGRRRFAMTHPAVDRGEERAFPASGEVVELDVVLGPRADWFTAESVRLLGDQLWRVSPQSSRVGIRLHGDKPLSRSTTRELPSEGMTSGAIQVPHDGQPILLLADYPVTGGYPVMAVVAAHHLDLAGQIPPGAQIRFRPVADDQGVGTLVRG